MTLAHIGIHVKHLAREITKSVNILALSSIHRQHVALERRLGRFKIIFQPLMVQNPTQSQAKLATINLVRCDVVEEQHCSLQLVQ